MATTLPYYSGSIWVGRDLRGTEQMSKGGILPRGAEALKPFQPDLFDDLPESRAARLNASARWPRAGGRFACWNQKAVRESETSDNPSTFGAGIEGQIRLTNEESGPVGTRTQRPSPFTAPRRKRAERRTAPGSEAVRPRCLCNDSPLNLIAVASSIGHARTTPLSGILFAQEVRTDRLTASDET